ncbi:MAG: AAA family ATPase [Methylococcales bacterium]|nr:AAA family ATPase [Methylococcales bacterium]
MTQLTAQQLTLNLSDAQLTKASAKAVVGDFAAQRTLSALDFGLAMMRPGYHIYVTQQPGFDALLRVREAVARKAATLTVDVVYAYGINCAEPRRPVLLSLPPARQADIEADFDALLDNIVATFPAVFDSTPYQRQKAALQQNFDSHYQAVLSRVAEQAVSLGVVMREEQGNIQFSPSAKEPLSADQISQFQRHAEQLEHSLHEALLDLPSWRRQLEQRFRLLDKTTVESALRPLFAPVHDKYAEAADLQRYLKAMERDLRTHLPAFLAEGQEQEGIKPVELKKFLSYRYGLNFLTESGVHGCAPVVYLGNPTFPSLLGYIETVHEQDPGQTHHGLIRPGALQRANGGYLLMPAAQLLVQPGLFQHLKHVLDEGCLDLDGLTPEPGAQAQTLHPEALPVQVKIILLGDREIYYLWQELDEEFTQHFRVLADFDDTLPINADTLAQFAGLLQTHAQTCLGKPLTQSGLARLVVFSCRLAEAQNRLSCQVDECRHVLDEAMLFAGQALDAEAIEQALTARELRHGRVAEELVREVCEGTVLIATAGQAIGKINGLTVLEVGGSSYGAPARISATVFPGSRGIVDIEREVELGQAIHSKGVMILSGYLGHCYAQKVPLAICAHIAMEQSYGHVDGDSAALAELCALISALTQQPIKQALAVTGSINQYGEVQAVGGVNDKIEGFFSLCQARGLTGDQGVLLPAANVRHLLLKTEVIDAVRDGLFHLYPVSHVDQALALLFVEPVGALDASGNYPEHSIHGLAVARLKQMADLAGDAKK